MAIHPTAVVEDGALVDPTAEIGPWCYVGSKVRIGPETRLLHSVTLLGRTTLGARNVVHPYAVIGGDPQDLKFRGEDSVTLIGDDNIFREGLTVHKGTLLGGGKTVIGNRNYLMAGVHVAHDSIIEDQCILANAAMLAGHVRVEFGAIISGMVAVHHFVTIGRLAFIGGVSRINRDCPPFMITQGFAGEVRGVNSVGLRRRGVKPPVINALREAHRTIWRSGLPKPEALAELERRFPAIEEIRTLIGFLKASDQGRLGRARESLRTTPVVPEPEAELLE